MYVCMCIYIYMYIPQCANIYAYNQYNMLWYGIVSRSIIS